MSSKTLPVTDIGKFYKQVKDFKSKIEIILNQYGHQDELIELQKYYSKLKLAKKVNVRTPIELLYEKGISKFAENILKRDESFFLSKVTKVINGDEEIADINPHDIVFIKQINGVWSKLKPNIRDNIWDYIQVICLLAEKIVGGTILSTTRKMLAKEGKLENK